MAGGSVKENFDKALEGIKNVGSNTNATLDSTKNAALTVVTSGDALWEQIKSGGPRNKGSIAKLAKQNLFEFPVFVADDIPLDYATAANTLLEQLYAAYLQMAIAANPVVDGESLRGGNPFSKWKNDKTNKYLEGADITKDLINQEAMAEYMECVDTTYQADACHNVITEGDVTCEFTFLAVDNAESKFINEAFDYQPLQEFDHYFQEAKGGHGSNDPKQQRRNQPQDPPIPPEPQKQTAPTASTTPKSTAAPKSATDTPSTSNRRTQDQTNLDKYRASVAKKEPDAWDDDHERAKTREERENEIGEKTKDAVVKEKNASADRAEFDNEHKQDMYDSKMAGDAAKTRQSTAAARLAERQLADADDDTRRSKEKHMVDMKVKASQIIDETKLQKLNTMKPLMMIVNVRAADAKGGVSDMIEYVVGVKTHMRVVDSSILPEAVKYPMKEMNRIARKVKWRAGELKFFKDFLLKIKERKQSAVDAKDPRRKWYRRLYALAHDSITGKFGKTISKVEESMPNASLIISKSDVDMIKSEVGVDLLKAKSAVAYCREMFYMSLVVIDTDAQSVKIIVPDLNNDYDVHSLASLNKQIATLDTAGAKVNDMFKMLGR